MKFIIALSLFHLLFSTPVAEERLVSAFKDTEAYELAKAVEKEDLSWIENLVTKNPKLLHITSTTGANVLTMCLYIEKFEAFKKLLELGADPNFNDPYSRESALIEACKPFGSQFEWRYDNRYAELLLKYGADPNYVVPYDFTDEQGHYHYATSPLIKASSLKLDLVKLLIKYKADPYRKVGKAGVSPFSSALDGRKYDIINYYIDELKVNIFRPLYVREKDTLYIQDFVVTPQVKAKIMGGSMEGTVGKEEWELIKKLERMGVDFKNYKYKRLD